MKERDGFWPMLCILILMAALALYIAMQGQAKAESKSDWFRSLMRPDVGTSCCDDSDCKADEKAYFRDGSWWTNVNGTMQPVPDAKILKNKDSWDGRAYACIFQNQILCFVRPGGGA